MNLELNKLGPTTTELSFNGNLILFSYKTPVAYQNDKNGQIFVTKTKYSVTTSKHINKWLCGRQHTLVDQTVIDNLVK